GNRRFVAELGRNGELSSESRRRSLATRQQPFAIILGCSDSRVPAELIFDQGLGDLFVIRVAGNIVAPSQIDSVEFSAVLHRARLVVVLGHTQCGAILSTIEALNQPADDQARKLRSIVDRVRPSVEMLMETEVGKNRDELIRHSVRNNIRMSVNQLRRGSAALEHLIEHEGLRVVGAEYSLETGVVEFFNY
ncbi:carbonic anhydrase, partial [Dokdonella sp.]